MKREFDFFIPDAHCPERFQTEELTSDVDCLPSGVLEELIEEIRDANEELLDLALEEDRTQDQIFQRVFDGLIGLAVEIDVKAGGKVEGFVNLSGFDFVSLRTDGNVVLLPYRQIESVHPAGKYAEQATDPELAEIDPCFRRDLTYRFGEVVASSPELIHLFFRIRLSIYLLQFEAKRLQAFLNGETVEGLLTDVDRESIVLKTGEDHKVLPINKILKIII